jgi:hypothetical protein
MIKSIWNLFLAIIARPVKEKADPDYVETAPLMHFYPIPPNIKEFSKEEIQIYASELTEFMLQNLIKS